MEPYPVYFEKEGEYVAEFKFTVLIMPNGTMKISGIPLDIDSYQTENSITDEAIKVNWIILAWIMGLFSNLFLFLYNLLALSLTTKKKKKKKTGKKTDKAAGGDEESSEDEKEKK